MQHHAACNVQEPQWYPTRLLDLGESPASTGTVRLVLKDIDHLSGPYVTLSHCWGTAEFLTLNTTNFEILRAGISILELPQTFQNAIVVTRRFGIRYLWIDSICIMQDLESDWQVESLLMEKVFSRGHCSIAATASSDSAGGLFRRRDPKLLCPIEIIQPVTTDGPDQVTAKRYTAYDRDCWRRGLDKAPLCRRAWVVQERLLAHRVVHFTHRELVWECKELTASETHPSGAPIYGVLFSRDLDGRPGSKWTAPDANSRVPYSAWSRIQAFYYACA